MHKHRCTDTDTIIRRGTAYLLINCSVTFTDTGMGMGTDKIKRCNSYLMKERKARA